MVLPRSSPSKMIWASSLWASAKYELDASSWASHNQSSPLPRALCVPKTSSVLIARPNRLNVSRMNRAALLPPDPARLAQQAENEVDERVHRVVVLQIHYRLSW